METVYLGLGSNLQDRLSFLKKAIENLNRHKKISVKKISSVYETDPVGGELQGRYLNAVCAIATDLEPKELLRVTKEIEYEMGRRRKGTWEARFIDIDILIYPGTVIASEDLNLPHPLLAERFFVLVPLAEIAPNIIPPGFRKSASQLLEELGEPVGIDRLNIAPLSPENIK